MDKTNQTDKPTANEPLRSHELARLLLAMPDAPVGIRAYGRCNAWPTCPPKMEAWDDSCDSTTLKSKKHGLTFVLLETA
jgi:hypothetical protein